MIQPRAMRATDAKELHAHVDTMLDLLVQSSLRSADCAFPDASKEAAHREIVDAILRYAHREIDRLFPGPMPEVDVDVGEFDEPLAVGTPVEPEPVP